VLKKQHSGSPCWPKFLGTLLQNAACSEIPSGGRAPRSDLIGHPNIITRPASYPVLPVHLSYHRSSNIENTFIPSHTPPVVFSLRAFSLCCFSLGPELVLRSTTQSFLVSSVAGEWGLWAGLLRPVRSSGCTGFWSKGVFVWGLRAFSLFFSSWVSSFGSITRRFVGCQAKINRFHGVLEFAVGESQQR